MVGVYPLDAKDPSTYIFDHCDITKDDDVVSNRNKLQGVLNETTTLVGHNNISRPTMALGIDSYIRKSTIQCSLEYILNRGIKRGLKI